MLFSYRKGLKKLRQLVQTDDIDLRTRNLLWSSLCEIYWDNVSTEIVRLHGSTGRFYSHPANQFFQPFFRAYWLHFLHLSIDQFQDHWPTFFSSMRQFFFTCKWHELFDYLEFVYQHTEIYNRTDSLIEAHNNILESELVPYRVVHKQFTDITSPQEIAEVEQASADLEKPVRTHISTAITYLYDRKTPDFRNSIKESISAVEAESRIISRNEKATLVDAIKVISRNNDLHPAFVSALEKLYGYTSDESGIRHSLTETDRVDFADAKFMLVACSAFVNYMKTKLK